jgi:hypothetical protein
MTIIEHEAERAKQLILDTFKGINTDLITATAINFNTYPEGKTLSLQINLQYVEEAKADPVE